MSDGSNKERKIPYFAYFTTPVCHLSLPDLVLVDSRVFGISSCRCFSLSLSMTVKCHFNIPRTAVCIRWNNGDDYLGLECFTIFDQVTQSRYRRKRCSSGGRGAFYPDRLLSNLPCYLLYPITRSPFPTRAGATEISSRFLYDSAARMAVGDIETCYCKINLPRILWSLLLLWLFPFDLMKSSDFRVRSTKKPKTLLLYYLCIQKSGA